MVTKKSILQLPLFDAVRTKGLPTTLPEPRSPAPGRETSIIDEEELKEMWRELQDSYFPDRADLRDYTVCWSSRTQKRTLASCSISRKRVAVARELQPRRYEQWLAPLLYHEMCHAYLGLDVTLPSGRRAWHGREFKELERRHPDMVAFHTWVDEGGWRGAVRSDRAKRAHAKRKTVGRR